MSYEKPRPVMRPVQLRPQHGPEIPDGNLHRIRRRALRLSRDVVRRPCEHDRHGRVDPCGREDGARVAGPRRRGAQQHDVAHARDRRGGEDQGRSAGQTLREVREEEGYAGCEGVRGYGEQLGLGGGVAEPFNDGREE